VRRAGAAAPLAEAAALVGTGLAALLAAAPLAAALARIFHQQQVGGLVPKRVFIGICRQ
jgi:hypothetical protein